MVGAGLSLGLLQFCKIYEPLFSQSCIFLIHNLGPQWAQMLNSRVTLGKMVGRSKHTLSPLHLVHPTWHHSSDAILVDATIQLVEM
jgi:hypothetical protein